MSTQNDIQVGLLPASEDIPTTAWMRVEGKGTFLNSGGVRDFARGVAERGCRHFVIDLGRCPVMDSSFMGTLAGIALQLRAAGGGELRIIRANERNRGLLSNLGLDRLFIVEREEPGSPAPTETPGEPELRDMDAAPCDREEQARAMLAAHEALVEAAPENRVKFKDVLEFLKQDLGQ